MTLITLASGGSRWTQWKSLSVSKTIDSAQHKMSISTTDRIQTGLERWNILGGSEIRLFFDVNLIFEGYVTKYSPSVSETEHAISVECTTRSVDAVESSHDGTLFWKDTSPEEVIREVLSPFGIQTNIMSPMTMIESEGFKVAPNTSAYDVVKRLAERDGLLIYTNTDSSFTISDGAIAFSPAQTIVRGDWCSISSTHDIGKSYSEVRLKTQRKSYNYDYDERQMTEEVFTSSFQNRHRPLVVVDNTQFENDEKLGRYIERRLNNDSITAQVEMKSFSDKSGRPWEVGGMVRVFEPLIDVTQTLQISSVNYDLSESGGITTNLTLKTPEGYSTGTASASSIRRSSGAFGSLLGSFS